MGSIHPAVSEICVPQSLDPICAKFDKFLAHGQAHMGQMGKWPWRCTTTGLDNSTELRMEKIHQAVTEIWVPKVWQPPAHPPGPWRQYPSSPEGWGVKTITTPLNILSSVSYILDKCVVARDYSGVLCQKQVSRAGTSNYIPQILWDVITCSCPWYLHLTQHSWILITYPHGICTVGSRWFFLILFFMS